MYFCNVELNIYEFVSSIQLYLPDLETTGRVVHESEIILLTRAIKIISN
jgi:hypothetical protein